MAYTAYDKTKPDATTQAGAAFGASTKSNLLALRDAVVAGAVPEIVADAVAPPITVPTESVFAGPTGPTSPVSP
jgi:hypothetical protein